MALQDLCILFIMFWNLKYSAFAIPWNSAKFPSAKNWRQYNNETCLIYVSEAKSFSGARADCRIKNGDLVMLENREKINFVVGRLLESEAWIGLRPSFLRSSRFVWYINAKQPVPGYLDSKTGPRCVYVKPNGQWRPTYNCSEKRPYICQSRACPSDKSCSDYDVNVRHRRSKSKEKEDDDDFTQIRVLPSVKDEEKATPNHDWAIRAEGPLLYLNPVTCSLFIILLTVFLALYVVFIKSLKRSIEQIKDDIDRRRDRTRFLDGSVYYSLPFNT